MAGITACIHDRGYRELDPQESVLDKDLTAPPVSPAQYDRYIVASVATGAWATHEKEVTEYTGLGWEFFVPTTGFQVYVEDEDSEYTYTSGGFWAKSSAMKEILNFDKDSGPSQVIKVLSTGTIIKCVTVNVTTVFDSGFTISVGFPADNDEIALTTDCLLTELNLYKFNLYRTSAASETITAYFAGSSTGGAGTLIVEFI